MREIRGDFVKEGGGLVALHEASVANEFGDVRKDFGLTDVMGVHFKGTSDHSAPWPNYPNWVQVALNILKPEHPILDHPQMRSNIRGGDRVEYIGWMTERRVGDRNAKSRPPTDRRRRSGRSSRSTRPIRVSSVYFACDLGQAYFIAPYTARRLRRERWRPR